MGGPLVDSSAEGVSRSSCLCPSTCEKAGFEHTSCARPEDENLEARIACAQDDLVVEEIGLALAETMQVYNDNDDEGTDLSEDSDENDDPLSLDSDSNDDLVDVDTKLVTSSASLSGNLSDDGNSLKNMTPMLVSAMKGSRAKRGILTKLSVSWAPDVYDPPVTSDSHTVRPHHRSSRKSHYKYKPPKGSSSSRSSSGSKKDKKHSHHSSNSGSSKRDKKSSHRSTNGSSSSRADASDPQHRKPYVSSISSRTETSDPQHGTAYGSSISSRIDTPVREYDSLSLWLPPDTSKMEEAVPQAPVLKTMEQIKRSTSSCKDPPLSMLSRQFVSAKYKGMFSFWGQNQLAS